MFESIARLFGKTGSTQAKTSDPIPGEIWALPLEKGPWPPARGFCRIHEIKNGWVRYRYCGLDGWETDKDSQAKIESFIQTYERFSAQIQEPSP